MRDNRIVKRIWEQDRNEISKRKTKEIISNLRRRVVTLMDARRLEETTEK